MEKKRKKLRKFRPIRGKNGSGGGKYPTCVDLNVSRREKKITGNLQKNVVKGQRQKPGKGTDRDLRTTDQKVGGKKKKKDRARGRKHDKRGKKRLRAMYLNWGGASFHTRLEKNGEKKKEHCGGR